LQLVSFRVGHRSSGPPHNLGSRPPYYLPSTAMRTAKSRQDLQFLRPPQLGVWANYPIRAAYRPGNPRIFLEARGPGGPGRGPGNKREREEKKGEEKKGEEKKREEKKGEERRGKKEEQERKKHKKIKKEKGPYRGSKSP
jgi:hypothetical protein